MGLNFHVRCKTHKVVGTIARMEEAIVLHSFYEHHANCRTADRDAVEVQADEASEQYWMVFPRPDDIVDLGLLDKQSLWKIRQQINGWPVCHDLAATVYCNQCAPSRP